MSGERADRLAALVADEGLDKLIVGDLVRPATGARRRREPALADRVQRHAAGWRSSAPRTRGLLHRLPLHGAGRRERSSTGSSAVIEERA